MNIGGHCGSQNQQGIYRFSVKIEEQAGYKQYKILKLERHNKIQQKYRRQKVINKTDGGK